MREEGSATSVKVRVKQLNLIRLERVRRTADLDERGTLHNLLRILREAEDAA